MGRFLEHSLIFYFHNKGDYDIYLSSGDWMDRNFFRRVETCLPVEEKRMKKKLLKEGLQVYLTDNTQAWILQSDGSYKQSVPGNANPHCSQTTLLETYAN